MRYNPILAASILLAGPTRAADDLSVLVKDLKQGKPEARIRAAGKLEALGPRAAEATSALADALKDSDPAVCAKAAEALMQIGGQAEAAVPALTEALTGSPDTRLRRKAAIALGLIRRNPKLAVPALVQALEDKDSAAEPTEVNVRQAAATALGNFGADAKGAAPQLLKAAQSEDKVLAAISLTTLARTKADPVRTVQLAMDALRDSKQQQLWPAAALALQVLGPDAKEAVAVLQNAFPCEGVESRQAVRVIRERILAALGSLGARGAGVVPWILRVAENPDHVESTRLHAIGALRSLGPSAKSAIPKLIHMLNDPELPPTRGEAIAEALAAIGSDAVEPLSRNLKTDETMACAFTIQALKTIGPAAAAAIPALERVANGKHQDLSAAAKEAIAVIQDGKP